MGGVPLDGARHHERARRAPAVDLVVVSTDDPEIAAVAREWGAEVVDRPAALSGDEASSETAVLHAMDELEKCGTAIGVVVLVQATSPFIDSAALDRAIERVVLGDCDAVFSAVSSWGFLWRGGATG